MKGIFLNFKTLAWPDNTTTHKHLGGQKIVAVFSKATVGRWLKGIIGTSFIGAGIGLAASRRYPLSIDWADKLEPCYEMHLIDRHWQSPKAILAYVQGRFASDVILLKIT